MKNSALAVTGAVAAFMLFLPTVTNKEELRAKLLDPLFSTPPPKILFVGDLMFDRAVARHRRTIGNAGLFQGVREVFAKHDLVVGNLEGTITTNPSVAEVDNTILRFTFEPIVANILRDAGMSVVSLANNHALDFGEFGFENTLQYLDAAGIAAFGSPFNERPPLATKVGDKTFCFVGYHELFRRDPATVLTTIKELEPKCEYTIVFAHWGVEYETTPSKSQRELAHLFVDAGVDLIIGAHPHVVQLLEIYNNVAIFYSLGNFIFDQHWRPEVRRGVMVSVEFGEWETSFTLIPVNTYLNATLADEAVSAAVLADLGIDSPHFILSK
jgi:poly-gamma-glutamate synthesis protein (capsule biosynthesis protein)